MEKKKLATWLFALSAFILIIALGYIVLPVAPPAEEEYPVFENVEDPILKNSELGLENGERYFYLYDGAGETGNITFLVGNNGGCRYISTPDIEISRGVCLDNAGNDYTGSNVTFADPSIFMFKPWMLAVDDHWAWNVSVYAVKNNTRNYVFDIGYRTIRTDIINGRPAYLVEIDMGGSMLIYDWVDAEKRILVKEESMGTEIVLAEGLE